MWNQDCEGLASWKRNSDLALKDVPFFRPSIGEEEIAEVVDTLRSGWLTTGPKTQAFEANFSAFIGGDVHAVAVNSATAGLHLALEAAGIGQGDEVICPTLTFTATAEVIRYLGAVPKFVDIEEATLNVSCDLIEAAIGPKTKAVMPVHFAGLPVDMPGVQALADKHGLKVIDDAAHALPTRCQGQLIGNTGADATVFSFYASKTMTTGEGGMLVTGDRKLAARARQMRLHGIDSDVFKRFTDTRASWQYDVIAPGFKYNMTDLAASLGLCQLRRVEEFRHIRQRLASRYTDDLAGLPLTLPPCPCEGDTHSWHLYVVRLTNDAPCNRDHLIYEMKKRGVRTSVHYRPLHK
ncbi:MAG: DegT/DnrJ/EryC1/StrS family aminotransferase, partial [Rhizobiaceae bacterium]